jgi:hypothetical protein
MSNDTTVTSVQSTVVVQTSNSVIVTSVAAPSVIETSAVGAPGESGVVQQFTALSPITAGQPIAVVAGGVVPASCTTQAHGYTSIGIAVNTVTAGSPVSVRLLSLMTSSNWAWAPGLPVVVGANGTLTQSLPLGALFLKQLAVAITATQILVSPMPVVFLA